MTICIIISINYIKCQLAKHRHKSSIAVSLLPFLNIRYSKYYKVKFPCCISEHKLYLLEDFAIIHTYRICTGQNILILYLLLKILTYVSVDLVFVWRDKSRVKHNCTTSYFQMYTHVVP